MLFVQQLRVVANLANCGPQTPVDKTEAYRSIIDHVIHEGTDIAAITTSNNIVYCQDV